MRPGTAGRGEGMQKEASVAMKLSWKGGWWQSSREFNLLLVSYVLFRMFFVAIDVHIIVLEE